MKKHVISALLLGVSLSLSQTLLAAQNPKNPASTEYVNQHISQAIDSLTGSFQQEFKSILTQMQAQHIQTHQIGEHYQGGIIFFVDESGIHGLIAARQDANNGEGIQWKNGESGEKIVNANGFGIGSGESNTRLIIAQQTIDYQPGNFAALVAANFSVLNDGQTPCATKAEPSSICYGDWYLPSIYELDLMRLNLGEKGVLGASSYWSSTEHGVSDAWMEEIQTGTQSLSDKANASGLVRAIRAF